MITEVGKIESPRRANDKSLLKEKDSATYIKQMFGKRENDPGLEEFSRQKVQIVVGNNYDCVFVTEEYDDLEKKSDGGLNLDPNHISIIKCPRVKANFVEYFPEELIYTTEASSPIIKPYAKARLPKILDGKRFSYGRAIGDALKESDVFIATADLADKPSYLLADPYLNGLVGCSTPVIGVVLREMLSRSGIDIPDAVFKTVLTGSLLPSILNPTSLLLSSGWDMLDNLKGRSGDERNPGVGVYSRHETNLIEFFTLSFEKARRQAVVKAIGKIGEQFGNSKKTEDKPVFVINYPSAHALRIIDGLLHPNFLRVIEEDFYKIMGKYLNWDVGLWRWKNGLARLSNKPELAGWDLVSTTSI